MVKQTIRTKLQKKRGFIDFQHLKNGKQKVEYWKCPEIDFYIGPVTVPWPVVFAFDLLYWSSASLRANTAVLRQIQLSSDL